MFKLFLNFIFLLFLIFNQSFADDGFNEWKIKFKSRAINSGISEKVVNEIMADAIFLPKVIEYDRFQPEFYEDTFTYIKKRSSKNKVREGLKLYKKNKNLIEIVVIGFLVSVFGSAGDLIESKFKRQSGMKDSGNLLKSHGGIYDRLDSLIFTAPFIYLLYFLNILNF